MLEKGPDSLDVFAALFQNFCCGSISPVLIVVHFSCTVLSTFQAFSRSWKGCLGLFVALSSVVLHLSAETLNFLGGLLQGLW